MITGPHALPESPADSRGIPRDQNQLNTAKDSEFHADPDATLFVPLTTHKQFNATSAAARSSDTASATSTLPDTSAAPLRSTPKAG